MERVECYHELRSFWECSNWLIMLQWGFYFLFIYNSILYIVRKVKFVLSLCTAWNDSLPAGGFTGHSATSKPICPLVVCYLIQQHYSMHFSAFLSPASFGVQPWPAIVSNQDSSRLGNPQRAWRFRWMFFALFHEQAGFSICEQRDWPTLNGHRQGLRAIWSKVSVGLQVAWNLNGC